MGQRFNHGPEPYGHGMGFLKSIRPTRTVFHGGLHMAGACKLPVEWNGCTDGSEFCISGEVPYSRQAHPTEKEETDLHLSHHFDQLVTVMDARRINASAEGVLNHLQYRRQYEAASKTAQQHSGDYSATLFSPVYEALERRGLVMPVELPEKEGKPGGLTSSWILFNDVYKSVENDFAAKNKKNKKNENKNANTNENAKETEDKKSAAKNGKEDGIYFDDFTNTKPPSSPRRLSLKDIIQNRTTQTVHTKKKNNEDFGLSILPAFAKDKSEMFLSSMIEREADSWDLYVTTFLLCHQVLKPENFFAENRLIRDDPESLTSWSEAITAFNGTKYEYGGIRITPARYTCRITVSSSSAAYDVKGENGKGGRVG
jgi:hypothetical protein